MTGYGFAGPMTAQGTVFDAKATAAAAGHQGSVYLYGYLSSGHYSWLFALLGW